MRDTVRFLKGGEIIELKNVGPTDTLLDYLRLERRQTGTKEGCGEGDCGACTVAVGRVENNKLVYRPVNSCIHLLAMIDGAELVTVEDLASDGKLHPVQQSLADLHGSQCGFCTPGFVMSMFTLYHAEGQSRSRQVVTQWLAGNLCRCTGYRPIIDAALQSCFETADDCFTQRADETVERLKELADRRTLFIGSAEKFVAAPTTLDALSDLYDMHKDATLVAGATDVGLWITKHLKELPKVILLGRVADLCRLEETPAGILMGACVTYEAAHEAMANMSPDLGELWSRIASRQIRSSGTIGGNIANGSPIGDTPPALIALGTTLELQKGRELRTLRLEDYFKEYGKQDREPGEFVTGVFVPRPDPNHVFRCYKISKRFDQDISAVMGAFRFTIVSGTITEARIAYGGMAGTPCRAKGAETSLIGAELDDPASWSAGMKALFSDFSPLSDMRASADYRMETARALLAKALMEASGSDADQLRLKPVSVLEAAE